MKIYRITTSIMSLLLCFNSYSQTQDEIPVIGSFYLDYEFTGKIDSNKDSIFIVNSIIEIKDMNTIDEIIVKAGDIQDKKSDKLKINKYKVKEANHNNGEFFISGDRISISLGQYKKGNSYWEFEAEDLDNNKLKLKPKHNNK